MPSLNLLILRNGLSVASIACSLIAPVAAGETLSVEAQLCRSQLELLQSRNKLTDAESAVFEAQCSCLEELGAISKSSRDCAQRRDETRLGGETSSATEVVDAETNWQRQKCAAYASSWNQVLEVLDLTQVNYAFIAGNENFIASNCMSTSEMICPRSNVEIEVANTLTLAMMNSGAASTFLPFKCAVDSSVPSAWTGPGL